MTTLVASATPPLAPDATSRPREGGVQLVDLQKSFPIVRGWKAMLRAPWRTEHSPVIQRISLDIRPGEFFGLLGQNGAGKTTLFKMLATLVTPDSGTATVAGFDVVHQAAQVRRVLAPVIADERSLHWRLTARDNLLLFATLYGLRDRAARIRVDELLETVGLADTGSKMVGAFSSGMKQRLLISRALLTRPSVLLLDEPTRSLDPLSARAFRAFLREEISVRQGCTVLLATHNAAEAFELCHRVAVLDRGRLLAVGPTERLLQEYGDESYRVWTKQPDHPAIASLVDQGIATRVVRLPGEQDGWSRVDIYLTGGLDRSARVVDYLGCAGVTIGRFESVTLSLADLIERILARRMGEPDA